MARRPNVLVIMADQWRAQAFGYAGDPNARTPNIDRLAAESMDFRQAVSGTPVCCPARASFVTGRYPLEHGVYINDVQLKPEGDTLGEVFRSSGYRTGYVGKWHLFGSPDGRYGRRAAYIPREQRFGFDYWKVGECTHDYNYSFYYDHDDPEMRFWPGYDAFAQTDDVCQFLADSQTTNEPFFMVVSFGPPHFPHHTAPDEFQKLYRDREIVLRPNVPPEMAELATAELRGYYAHGAALDACVGRLLDALDAARIASDTIVMFTSDHGDMMGSHGFSPALKLLPWDESVRVPLLVRYPARFGTSGQVSDTAVNTPDIMPLLLGLCDIPIPAHVSGSDPLSPDTSSRPSSSFLNLPAPFTNARWHGIGEYRGVRTDRYTYVRSRSGPWLLYDNATDQYQVTNLVDDPAASDVRAGLDAELERWLDRLGDGFEDGDDYLRRDSLTHYSEVQGEIGSAQSPWGDWSSNLTPTSGRKPAT